MLDFVVRPTNVTRDDDVPRIHLEDVRDTHRNSDFRERHLEVLGIAWNDNVVSGYVQARRALLPDPHMCRFSFAARTLLLRERLRAALGYSNPPLMSAAIRRAAAVLEERWRRRQITAAYAALSSDADDASEVRTRAQRHTNIRSLSSTTVRGFVPVNGTENSVVRPVSKLILNRSAGGAAPVAVVFAANIQKATTEPATGGTRVDVQRAERNAAGSQRKLLRLPIISPRKLSSRPLSHSGKASAPRPSAKAVRARIAAHPNTATLSSTRQKASRVAATMIPVRVPVPASPKARPASFRSRAAQHVLSVSDMPDLLDANSTAPQRLVAGAFSSDDEFEASRTAAEKRKHASVVAIIAAVGDTDLTSPPSSAHAKQVASAAARISDSDLQSAAFGRLRRRRDTLPALSATVNVTWQQVTTAQAARASRKAFAKRPHRANDGAKISIVLLRRRDKRRIANEEQLISGLQTVRGAVITGLGDWALPDAVDIFHIFAYADVVVGAHGAGLANVVVARPGACIIEFLPEQWLIPCYLRLSGQLGLQHHAFVVDGGYHGAITVDVPRAVAAVRECIANLPPRENDANATLRAPYNAA